MAFVKSWQPVCRAPLTMASVEAPPGAWAMALLAFPARFCLAIDRAVRILSLLMSAAVLAFPATAEPAQPGAAPEAMVIPLKCRLRDGPWQDCRMRVEQVGAHWFLLLDGQTIEFRHDGRGAVTMQQHRGDWRSVNSRWLEDTSLCWDGICAKGPIPLD